MAPMSQPSCSIPPPAARPAMAPMSQPSCSIPPPAARPAMAPAQPTVPVLGAQYCPRPRPVQLGLDCVFTLLLGLVSPHA